MTVAAVEHAVALCQRHPSAHFAGPRPESVPSAESALGVALPPSYRRFVERLGAGSIGPFEVYGLTSEPFDGPIPDAVWATLTSRRGPSQLPASMVVIGDDGMGGEYVLDTAKGAEPPVELWYGGASTSGDLLERVADSFGAFLLDGVRRATAP
jgi:antitoxin YobK